MSSILSASSKIKCSSSSTWKGRIASSVPISKYKEGFKWTTTGRVDISKYDKTTLAATEMEDVATRLKRLPEAAKQIDGTIGVLNESGDEQGAQLNDGEVTTPEGFKEAYAAYAESGWIGLDKDIEYDGQGLPYTLATAVTDNEPLSLAAFAALHIVPAVSIISSIIKTCLLFKFPTKFATIASFAFGLLLSIKAKEIPNVLAYA